MAFGAVQQALWTRKVVEDYMVIGDGSIGRQHRSLSLLLAGKHGRSLFLRASDRTWSAAGVGFIEMDRDTSMKLDAVSRRLRADVAEYS